MRTSLARLIAALAAVCLLLSFGARPADAIERQRAMNWCWAAVINDAIMLTGNYRSQVQIAADLDGWPRDRPAYIHEVVGLLRLYGFRAWQTGRPATVQELYGTLADGYVIIAFIRPNAGPVGHYVIVKGATRGGHLIIGDPADGRDSTVHPAYLYRVWADGIVVGR